MYRIYGLCSHTTYNTSVYEQGGSVLHNPARENVGNVHNEVGCAPRCAWQHSARELYVGNVGNVGNVHNEVGCAPWAVGA